MVKIAFAINSDEANDSVCLFSPANANCDRDLSLRYEFLTPALALPIKPRRKIDLRKGLLPSATPELNRCGFVLKMIEADKKGHYSYRSVSFSSMRRLRL